MARSSALNVHDSKVAIRESSKRSKPRIYGPREAGKTSSIEVSGPSAPSTHSQADSGQGWAAGRNRSIFCPFSASDSFTVVLNRVVVVS